MASLGCARLHREDVSTLVDRVRHCISTHTHTHTHCRRTLPHSGTQQPAPHASRSLLPICCAGYASNNRQATAGRKRWVGGRQTHTSWPSPHTHSHTRTLTHTHTARRYQPLSSPTRAASPVVHHHRGVVPTEQENRGQGRRTQATQAREGAAAWHSQRLKIRDQARPTTYTPHDSRLFRAALAVASHQSSHGPLLCSRAAS
jgi:hypothetical protein